VAGGFLKHMSVITRKCGNVESHVRRIPIQAVIYRMKLVVVRHVVIILQAEGDSQYI
jgi:hypothetical protein